MMCPGSKLPSMKYCPYCGEPLASHGAEHEDTEEPEGDEGGITILVVGGPEEDEEEAPQRSVPDIPKRLGLMPSRKDMGSFHDRVAKRIRRTVSGKE